MLTPVDDPDELHALAAAAMDHAMFSIQPRGPLLPFALIEDDSGQKLHRAVGGRLEEMVANTRRVLVSAPPPTRAALAWDGYTNLSGRRTDAIFIEAYEGGASGGILIAQPYRSAGLLKRRNEPVGRAAIIERGLPPLF